MGEVICFTSVKTGYSQATPSLKELLFTVLNLSKPQALEHQDLCLPREPFSLF